MSALLSVEHLSKSFGGLKAVADVSLTVTSGEICSVIGPNGAGKTTLFNMISGVLRPSGGSILFDGTDLATISPSRFAALGIGRTFQNLALFPRLFERRDQIAGYMSGGEQQMLAIGRALMTDPVLLALDEPSLGLAPLIIDRIYEVIAKLRDEMKMTVLLVEQNAQRALDIADYAYILETGRVVLDGTAQKLASNEDVQEFYLGVSNSGRKSLRDVKHYKRRKRWLS